MKVVHLELHTSDLTEARGFYSDLAGWRTERVETDSATYLALDLGADLGGGMVECGTRRSLWLPYLAVDEINSATARARELGASVMLGPREGPAGWRSVVSTPAGGEIAFWQQKEARV